jgi:hypothetical protein
MSKSDPEIAAVSPAASSPVGSARQPAARTAAEGDGHGLGWPVCRCGHPMHPIRREKHQGNPMERFACPRRRWWNFYLHPYVWEAPRD